MMPGELESGDLRRDLGSQVLFDFGRDLDELIDAARLLVQFKGIVQLADRSPGFETQLVTIDVDDLVELCVFRNAFHEVVSRVVVHLRAAHRNNVDGTRLRVALLDARGNIDITNRRTG